LNSYLGLNKNTYYCSIVCGSALFLASCVNYIGLHSKQHLKKPEQFTTEKSIMGDNGAWPTMDWAKQFDKQLPSLIEEGLANNPNLQTAVARQNQAAALVDAGNSALLPRITWHNLSSRNKAVFQRAHLLQNLGLTAVNFRYELDFWGKNYSLLAQALSEQKVSQAALYQSALILSTSIATLYNELDYEYRYQEVLLETKKQRELFNQITQRLRRTGLATDVQVYQARNSFLDVKTQLIASASKIHKLRQQLGVLLGKGPDRGLSIHRPQLAYLKAPRLPNQLPLHLLGRRPDIVAARWQVEASLHKVKYVKAQFYPDVDLLALAANFSLGAGPLFRNTNQFLGYATALTLPLFDGGYLRSQVKQSYAVLDEQIATYNASLNQALGDVAEQVSEIHYIDQQLVMQNKALSAARSAYQLAQKQYDIGLASQLVVLDTQTQYLLEQRAQLQLIKIRRDLQIALIKSLGGGFEERLLPTPRTTASPDHRLKKDEHV